MIAATVARTMTRGRRRAPAGLLTALVALLLVAPQALAKEGVVARLDAPIPRDAEPGTVIVVGFTLTVMDGDVVRPVNVEPAYVSLLGGDSISTVEVSEGEPRGRGHYEAAIVVPAGGITGVEIGVRGTTRLAFEIDGPVLADSGSGPGPAAVVSPAPSPTPVAIMLGALLVTGAIAVRLIVATRRAEAGRAVARPAGARRA